ncbi:MAG: DoxX family protein, partial [Bacteroidetes bacterium]
MNIAIVASILTVLVGLFYKGHKNWLMTWLQNFCGSLFVFSGWVKAVDPLGTAYKMEQYFAEFESTFSETWMSFVAPMFPWLSEHAILFSVFMIVFEIVLGLMLLMGAKPKFTSWAFLLLVVFFTFLTGFTYLTGYVPEGVNFFEFGKWGPYVETNMKVTDCGCFGDFLKLKPKISFLKDVFLLFPALWFVFRHKDMHQLFSAGVRNLIVGLSIVGLTVYCMSNYLWDIPSNDFRPFKVGENIGIRKAIEATAASNVPVLAYELRNKETGHVVRVPYTQYLKEFQNYPKEEWDAEQIRGDQTITVVKDANGRASILKFYEEIPAEQLSDYLTSHFELTGDTTVIPIATTKISDFDITDMDGNEKTWEVLQTPNYSFMIVAYKLYFEEGQENRMVYDTTYTYDTIAIEGTDSVYVERKVADVQARQVSQSVYDFDDDYVARYTEVVNPVLEAAQKEGVEAFAITAYGDPAMIEDFRHETQSAYPFYLADDIMLKTIVRSNPGIVLLKNGEIIQKWPYKQLPSYEEIKANWMK